MNNFFFNISKAIANAKHNAYILLYREYRISIQLVINIILMVH